MQQMLFDPQVPAVGLLRFEAQVPIRAVELIERWSLEALSETGAHDRGAGILQRGERLRQHGGGTRR